MPYITKLARLGMDSSIERLADKTSTLGDLAYATTRLYLTALGKPRSYASIAELIGVLETVKLELYRRVAAPYEDKKKNENGDVL